MKCDWNGPTEPAKRAFLAKSVGTGYLSYHAFLTANRLSEFVPPLLGLRDGLLFTEWIPQPSHVATDATNRQQLIDRIASYTAARSSPAASRVEPAQGEGSTSSIMGLTCWRKPSAGPTGPRPRKLMLSRVRRRLAAEMGPRPTLIDGKMRPAEWTAGGGVLLKTDFEHHGMGKNELNIIDPAYDLAEAILQFALPEQEEKQLLARYGEQSGDTLAPDRLFLHKLLAGAVDHGRGHAQCARPESGCPTGGIPSRIHPGLGFFDGARRPPLRPIVPTNQADAVGFATRGARCRRRHRPPHFRLSVHHLGRD